MRKHVLSAALCAVTLTLGCAASRPAPEFRPQPIEAAGWTPKVERFVVIVDDSASMRHRAPSAKKLEIATSLARSLNRTIPALDYDAGLRSFGQGGCLPAEETSLLTGMRTYSATEFGSALDRFTCADGNSPLDAALSAAGEDLGPAKGNVAVLAISDGRQMGQDEIDAARGLAERFGERLCIHVIQVGDDPAGEELLNAVAGVTKCGTRVNASQLTDGAAMAKFVQDALLVRDGDADGDGVRDSRDKCPNTPRGTKVDASGCPVDGDADGDGVADSKDKCPNTPAGVKVDRNGCPLDTDGDGVPDHRDKCPGTPAGTPVEADGCPPEGLAVVEGEWTIKGKLLFDTNKWDLKPDALSVLDRVAEFLKKNTKWSVEIQGHTDSTGSREWNLTLSQRRADSVRDYLVEKGVAAGRLTTKGFGPDEPVGSNDTAAGRAQNRRVDFRPMER